MRDERQTQRGPQRVDGAVRAAAQHGAEPRGELGKNVLKTLFVEESTPLTPHQVLFQCFVEDEVDQSKNAEQERRKWDEWAKEKVSSYEVCVLLHNENVDDGNAVWLLLFDCFCVSFWLPCIL